MMHFEFTSLSDAVSLASAVDLALGYPSVEVIDGEEIRTDSMFPPPHKHPTLARWELPYDDTIAPLLTSNPNMFASATLVTRTADWNDPLVY